MSVDGTMMVRIRPLVDEDLLEAWRVNPTHAAETIGRDPPGTVESRSEQPRTARRGEHPEQAAT